MLQDRSISAIYVGDKLHNPTCYPRIVTRFELEERKGSLLSQTSMKPRQSRKKSTSYLESWVQDNDWTQS